MYSVTKHIRSQRDSFSRKEKLIADYILDNREEFLNASIADNALNIGVSQASITKFSKKIGLKGLRSLKVELAKEHTRPSREVYSKSLSPEDEINDSMDKALNNTISSLYSTHKTVNYEEIERAAAALSNAPEAVLFGIGASRVPSDDLFLKLMRIGIKSVVPFDNHVLLTKIPVLEKGSVVVLFSTSGRTKEIIDILKLCRSNDVKTILVTQSINSPARNIANIVLSTSLEENNVRISTMTARISQLFLVDALFMRTAIKSGDDIFGKINTTHEAVQDYKMDDG